MHKYLFWLTKPGPCQIAILLNPLYTGSTTEAEAMVKLIHKKMSPHWLITVTKSFIFFHCNLLIYIVHCNTIVILDIYFTGINLKEETLWIKYHYSKGFNNITFNHLNLFDQFKKIIVWLHLITLETLMNYIRLISINLITLIT